MPCLFISRSSVAPVFCGSQSSLEAAHVVNDGFLESTISQGISGGITLAKVPQAMIFTAASVLVSLHCKVTFDLSHLIHV